MDEDPAQRRAPQEGLHARARGRGRARRQGRRPWSRPATPAPRWRRRCCAWAASRASAVRPSPPPIPVPGASPTVLLDAGANAEVPARVAGAVRPDGLGVRPAPLRRRPTRGSGCCRSARSRARATRCVKETYRAARRHAPGIHFIGNVEGRDVMTDERRRRRHRRLHRQRRAQDARGRAEGHRRRLSSTAFAAEDALQAPRRRAACRRCSRSTRPLEPRHLRRRRCCSGVDGVCIISHGSSSAKAIVNAINVAHEMVERRLVGEIRAAVARTERQSRPPEPAGTALRTRRPSPPSARRPPVPAETHVGQGPLDRNADLRDRPRPPCRHPRDRARRPSPRASRSSTTSTPTRWP